MRNVVTKILQYIVAVVFCFGAEGMQRDTFTCEEGYRPTSLSVSFESAQNALRALRRGIRLEYPNYAATTGQNQYIEFGCIQVRNADPVYSSNGVSIIGFNNIIDPQEYITLIFTLRDAFNSGTYVLSCYNHAESYLETKPQSQYCYHTVQLRFY